MKRDRCPTCHAEADAPCRELFVVPGGAEWVSRDDPHPARHRA
jgi:hypothetical protein